MTFFNRLRGRMRNWRTDGLDCATSTKYMLNTTKTMWMMLNDAQCRWSRRFSHSGPGACRHDLVKGKLLSRQSLCHNWKSSIENVNLTIMTSLAYPSEAWCHLAHVRTTLCHSVASFKARSVGEAKPSHHPQHFVGTRPRPWVGRFRGSRMALWPSSLL